MDHMGSGFRAEYYDAMRLAVKAMQGKATEE